MNNRSLWHLVRSSTFFGGTLTSWCGQIVRKRDVKRGSLWLGKTCRACVQAKKQHKRGGTR